MNKIMVIGCPGSGKRTLSRELSKLTGLPVYYLDMMNWNPDKTTVEKSVFRQRLAEAIAQEKWIIDGNYGSTLELRMSACDTVFFLDYPVETCLSGIMSRRGKPREDMPWIETEDEEDKEFLDFIKNYNINSRPAVIELLNKYADKNIIVFKNRNEADDFLSKYKITPTD